MRSLLLPENELLERNTGWIVDHLRLVPSRGSGVLAIHPRVLRVRHIQLVHVSVPHFEKTSTVESGRGDGKRQVVRSDLVHVRRM